MNFKQFANTLKIIPVEKNFISVHARWMLSDNEIDQLVGSTQSVRRSFKRKKRRAERKFFRQTLGIEQNPPGQFVDSNSKRQLRLKAKHLF